MKTFIKIKVEVGNCPLCSYYRKLKRKICPLCDSEIKDY